MLGGTPSDPEIRRLRTHTRYRRRLIQVRTAEKDRCEKLLEEAGFSEQRNNVPAQQPV